VKYLSVCSGIEAATQAWHPLGWEPVAFSEIEPFPCAVLAHHYPTVPNWGDMTKFKEWPDADVDVLCGGTPCQSFSVAGLRQGLADPRGNLMLTYLAIAARYRPRWLVWENVPGVLSSNSGRDFGTFLGALGQLGYGFSYRVLDAQHVRTRRFPYAVPQRRRRVFVVGYLGDWRRAAAVLFDRESLSGHPSPRRQSGQGFAVATGPRVAGGGRHIANSGDVGYCLTASAQGSLDAETETLVAHSLRGEGFDASEDGTGRGTPLVPVAYRTAGDGAVYEEGDVTAPLTTATDPNVQVVAFSGIDNGQDAACDVTPTLRKGGDGGQGMAMSVAFAQNQRDEVRTMDVAGALAAEPGMKQQTYLAQPMLEPFTIMERGREGGQSLESRQDGSSNAILTPNGGRGGMGVGAIALPWAVRRLTPVECERLQGFPDNYTNIPWRKKEESPDGPRYKALGNSWATPVVAWIGRRIQAHLAGKL
jgi:DNA (cytosine-5)-methyltransferase 1